MSQLFSFRRQDPTLRRRGFLESLLLGLSQVLEHAHAAEMSADHNGFLQRLDPRIKLIACLCLLVSCARVHAVWPLLALFALALGLASLSRIPLARLGGLWLGALCLSGAIALLAPFLVPGTTLCTLPYLEWAVTRQGLCTALLLIARALVSVTLVGLLILATPWTHLLKALRCLGVPAVVVALLGMTHRYIFVLLAQAIEMCEARRSRLIAPLSGLQQRQLVAASVGMLVGKALQLSGDEHLAMISRGYRGEIRLLHSFRTRLRDWLTLIVAVTIAWLMG